MRGKYSPTVSNAYQCDQSWFGRYSNGNQYDPEGFDSYGYDENDVDRAGNNELDYIYDDLNYADEFAGGENFLYNAALEVWGFDGTKPVREYIIKEMK